MIIRDSGLLFWGHPVQLPLLSWSIILTPASAGWQRSTERCHALV